MTFTYDPTDLAANPLMQLRLLIGDRDEARPLMQDEELEYWLDSEGGVREAAIAALEAAAATFSQKADRTIGPLRISYSQISAALCSRAQGLRIDRLALTVVPYAGGLSHTEKFTERTDTDRVDPFFTRDRFESSRQVTERLSMWYENIA
jgi:hypothetical protein